MIEAYNAPLILANTVRMLNELARASGLSTEDIVLW